MPIPVICPGCRKTFSVSDKFAGRTGPCPKCKHPITVPAMAAKDVKILAPEDTGSSRSTRVSVAPIEFVETPVPRAAYIAICIGGLASVALALLARAVWGAAGAPALFLGIAAVAVAIPCAWLGYRIVRDRDLQPHQGRAVILRSAICGAIYAALWGFHAFVPPETTAEMWPWVYLGPLFFGAGGLAALACFDLDWGAAVSHFSFYVMFTALLRWLAGFMPV